MYNKQNSAQQQSRSRK